MHLNQHQQHTVLIIGSGGREHAIAWKIASSSMVSRVLVAPGNGGTATEPKVTNIDIAANDYAQLIALAKKEQVTITIVGPEQPLVEGIVDQFTQAGLLCFGPTKLLAQLEGSKKFAKEFMKRFHIPTGKYFHTADPKTAKELAKELGTPVVLKADGLAAGKGVIIANNIQEIDHAVESLFALSASQNHSNQELVIEEFIHGAELSYTIMTDGQSFHTLANCQDYKRRFDGDRGPNTGGMGCYSPTSLLNKQLEERIIDKVVLPTLQGLKQELGRYRGFLYFGLMVSPSGDPYVLEYNCRLGDPEAQSIMLRLRSDLFPVCYQIALSNNKPLKKTSEMHWDSNMAVGVVMSYRDYPAKSSKGEILPTLPAVDENHVKIFHAGTKLVQRQLQSNGGRVFCVTALGKTIEQARSKSYDAVGKIMWNNGSYRTDIGKQAS